MDKTLARRRVETYLQKLCIEIPQRRVGSVGNREATSFFAERVADFGFEVESTAFQCLDWVENGARLTVAGEGYPVQVSPYSNGGRAQAPLVVASTLDELEGLEERAVRGRVLLLRGEIAQEQLMPKKFPFYNPEYHQRIISLLERKGPAAIVTATARNPELAGALYPFPLIEDGDFDIPSVYMTEEQGARLAERAGQEAALEIDAQRIPAHGYNVVARKGAASARLVVCAHIDAKQGTPGALDNAASVAALLLLAEMLQGYQGEGLTVELVAFNGEDDYSAAGEKLYLERNAGRLDEIVLAVNLDGAGYREGNTTFSLYECPDGVAAAIRAVFGDRPGIVEGAPWYQSDHMVFVMNGVPALAFTSDRFTELWNEIAHTERDRPELVDGEKLGAIAEGLGALVERVGSVVG
jgi:aminopeptidase YwaD